MRGFSLQGGRRLKCLQCNKWVIPEVRDVGKERWKTCPLCGSVLGYDYDKYVEYDRRQAYWKGGEELREEMLEEKIVIVCRNPDCGQELIIPDVPHTLRVTCPRCLTSFVYPANATYEESAPEATEPENDDTQYPDLENYPGGEEGEVGMATARTPRRIFLAWFLASLPVLVVLPFAFSAFWGVDLLHKLVAIIVFLFLSGLWILFFSNLWLDTISNWKIPRRRRN